MAAKKPAARKAAPAVIDQAGHQIHEAGDGATGSNPQGATEAGGDAGQDPTTSTGAAEAAATPAAANVVAGTDTPGESLVVPQGEAGGLAAPHAAGGGAEPSAAATPAVEAAPIVRIRALYTLEVDGVRIEVFDEAEIREELVAELLACRAAELVLDEAD